MRCNDDKKEPSIDLVHTTLSDIPKEIAIKPSKTEGIEMRVIDSTNINKLDLQIKINDAAISPISQITISVIDMDGFIVVTPRETPIVLENETHSNPGATYTAGQDNQEEISIGDNNLSMVNSLPIWYNNSPIGGSNYASYSVTKSRNKAIDEEDELEDEDHDVLALKKMIFYGFIFLIYVVLFITIYIYTSNIYHIISWFATFSSTSFVLFYAKILLFSKNLCFFQMKYKRMCGGVNYIPDGIDKDYGRSFDSISMISHIRGTTINKYHTLFVNLGSISVLFGAIIKWHDLCNNNNDKNTEEIIGVYLLILAGFGGIMHGNIEVYSSPSYSIKYNLILGYFHLFGVFLYAIFGVASFLCYTNMNLFSCILAGLTLILLFLYKINTYYQYNKDLNNDININKRSKINMSMELLAIIPSAIAMCANIYQFG